MREKIRTFFYGAIVLVLLPFVITLLFQGEEFFPELLQGVSAEPETETEGTYFAGIDVEGKVVAVLAKEISVNSEREAIKAQAVIARTNLIGARLTGEEEPEGLTTDQMMKQFGEDRFKRCYEKLADCVEETKGLVLTCRNKIIEAPYFSVSNGYTRSAGEAFAGEEIEYLKGVEAKEDILSENFLRVEFLEVSEFVEKCNQNYPDAALTAENIAEQVEVISRDDGEFVKELRIGGVTVNGEEFRKAMDFHSACFSIKEVEGKIRVVTEGYGHCVGLSQYGANVLAGEGKTYEEILKKYYTNIKITEYKNAE